MHPLWKILATFLGLSHWSSLSAFYWELKTKIPCQYGNTGVAASSNSGNGWQSKICNSKALCYSYFNKGWFVKSTMGALIAKLVSAWFNKILRSLDRPKSNRRSGLRAGAKKKRRERERERNFSFSLSLRRPGRRLDQSGINERPWSMRGPF